MQERWLTESQISRLTEYQAEIAAVGLIPFFTLTDDDRKLIAGSRHDQNQLTYFVFSCLIELSRKKTPQPIHYFPASIRYCYGAEKIVMGP
jgi:hypothetical protein